MKKRNIDSIKTAYRKKHTTMPYPHAELSKDPLEALEIETKVGFQADRLPKE